MLTFFRKGHITAGKLDIIEKINSLFFLTQQYNKNLLKICDYQFYVGIFFSYLYSTYCTIVVVVKATYFVFECRHTD